MKHLVLAAVLLSLAVGCSEAHPNASDSTTASAHAYKWEPDPAQSGGPRSSGGVTQPGGPAQPSAELSRRKIIYNGNIELLVDDFTGSIEKLDDLITQHQGLLAQSEINGDPRAPGSATWRVRIPVERFAQFVKQVAKLGEAVKNKTDSEDITDKFFDFQVRIDNKKVQVDRLQKIVKEQTGRLADVLEAERELSRVTTEMEELKGTVSLWDKQTALATVHISMRERKPYVKPEAPSFAKNVSETFWSSTNNFVAFVQSVVLVVVAFTPWTPVIAFMIGAFWLLVWRRYGQHPAISGAGGISGSATAGKSGPRPS